MSRYVGFDPQIILTQILTPVQAEKIIHIVEVLLQQTVIVSAVGATVTLALLSLSVIFWYTPELAFCRLKFNKEFFYKFFLESASIKPPSFIIKLIEVDRYFCTMFICSMVYLFSFAPKEIIKANYADQTLMSNLLGLAIIMALIAFAIIMGSYYSGEDINDGINYISLVLLWISGLMWLIILRELWSEMIPIFSHYLGNKPIFIIEYLPDIIIIILAISFIVSVIKQNKKVYLYIIKWIRDRSFHIKKGCHY